MYHDPVLETSFVKQPY